MRTKKNATAEIDFGGLVNALPGMVWITQSDGHGSFVNRSWREYTGLSLDEALAHGWQTALHPDDLGAFLNSWNAIRQSGVAQEIDGRLRRFDGEYRWFVFHASPLPDSGSVDAHWCWLGVCVDERSTLDGRLRRFFDMLPWQAGFLNTAGISEFSNRQSLNDFHMTQEQLEQWRTSGIIHVDDFEKNVIASTALLSTGKMYDEQIRMLYPGGEYRWTRARCVPVRDAHGNIVRYVTFQIDVDDLKRAETLLAAEVNLLEMVARGEPLGRVLDALSRHVEVLCHGCFCSILMVAPDAKHFRVGAGANIPQAFNEFLEGRTIDGGNDPCSLAVVAKSSVFTADVLEDSRWRGSEWPSLLKVYGYASCCALPIMSGSGEASGVITVYRPKAIGLTPAEQDLVDRFTKIAGIAIDRARADSALQMRERELREALSQLAEGQRLSKTGSFTWDVLADRHNWSEEVRRIFGFNQESTVTMAMVQATVHPEDIDSFESMIGDAVRGAPDFDLVFRILTTQGELRHAHVVGHRADLITDRPVFIGALQDVTERELAEERLNRARAELTHVARVATLSTMTASIAHEVSQPIAGILTNASTLVRMLAAEPPNLVGAAETARRTIRDANRASEVVKRLRAMFTKKLPTLERVDVNDATREVVALSSGELQRAHAVVQTHFAEGLPAVSCDRVQLQQVILNLLLNAADAMSGVVDRPRTLLIQTESGAKDSVRLLVRDSGVGVDPNAVEKLFDAFYTTKAHGMGVGLAISRSIIESHKGRLWAVANEGPGATFSFSIPGAPPEVLAGPVDGLDSHD
ncbi:MAG TPA: PAS domain-containing protein [Steroidobacteraceae bacterium]